MNGKTLLGVAGLWSFAAVEAQALCTVPRGRYVYFTPPTALDRVLQEVGGFSGSLLLFVTLTLGTAVLLGGAALGKNPQLRHGALLVALASGILFGRLWVQASLLCASEEVREIFKEWGDHTLALVVGMLFIVVPAAAVIAACYALRPESFLQLRSAARDRLHPLAVPIPTLTLFIGTTLIPFYERAGILLATLSVVPLIVLDAARQPDSEGLLLPVMLRLGIVGGAAMLWSGALSAFA